MVTTFINPVVNPDAKLGIGAFNDSDPVQLWRDSSESDFEIVIRAVYKQVLGNAHVMESERLVVPESQLKRGEITVREFVRWVAQSELYRSRFFENCPRYRAIELNFKHLLGRAPESYEEMTEHSQLLDRAGYDTEINSYIDGAEYEEAFGENIVPYYRGYKTQLGKRIVGFTHMFQLLRGASSSDRSGMTQNRSRLNRLLMTNQPNTISPITGVSASWQPPVTPASTFTSTYATAPQVAASPADLTSRGQYYQAYQPFKDDRPIELCPGSSATDKEAVIRAVYRQVLGNAHVMESERLVTPESQLKREEISVREFVRQVAKSELYRSRFFDNCYRYRSTELNFKHLLGRAPANFEEMRYHSTILDQGGFDAEIDSYVNSDEYQETFGENIVPYHRVLASQKNQGLLEFTNMFQLLRGASSSDKDLASNNRARLTRSLILKAPYGREKIRDVNDIIAEALRPKFHIMQTAPSPAPETPQPSAAEQTLQQTVQDQEALIATLQEQLATLRPFAAVGFSTSSQWGSTSATASSTPWSSSSSTAGSSNPLQQKVNEQAALISNLQGQLAEARALASIGEARLNKWRRR